MDQYGIYKIIEFMIFTIYLIFLFLSIQIWFLFRDTDKDKLMPEIFANEPFVKKNFAYVFFFSIFFMIHEFLEGTTLPAAQIFFEFFEMLAILCLSLFAYEWYRILKAYSNKTSLLQELSVE